MPACPTKLHKSQGQAIFISGTRCSCYCCVCVCVCLYLCNKMFLLLLCVFVTLRQVGPSPSPRWSWNTLSSGIHTPLEINKQTIDHIIDEDTAFWVDWINHCTNLGTFGQVMVTLTKSHIVDQYQCQLPC